MGNTLQGRVWKVGDDINTDLIIPARYLYTTDPKELGLHCLEDLDAEFPRKVQTGDIIVAGEDFGCGSSREHAPMALLGAGIACVIAKSFARIFYRNSINIGLPIMECSEAADKLVEGDTIEVDIREGVIIRQSDQAQFQAEPLSELMREIVNIGGLVEYVKAQSLKPESGFLASEAKDSRSK